MNESAGPRPLTPPEGLSLPVAGPSPARPDPELVERLRVVSSATASAHLHRMGIRQTFVDGPRLLGDGEHKVVGTAVTLQFMPQREDVASGMDQEHVERRTALWSVFEEIRPGDVLVVQAFGDSRTGCMGEMLATYLQSRGGLGVVVDGCIRDWPRVREMGLPIWACGVTPNYASQTTLFPWGYNVPIACSRVLVLPGDLVIADGDGAVVVPVQLAERLVEEAAEHEAWEEFSRMRLREGGRLRTYYPLSEEGRREYDAWRASGETSS